MEIEKIDDYIRKPDITQWAEVADKVDLDIGKKVDDIKNETAQKSDRLLECGLPVGVTHGPVDSFVEMEKLITEDIRDRIKYFIRCVPKVFTKNSPLAIQRKPFVTFAEARDFYNQISADGGQYTVTLFETWEPEYSGGIMVNNGAVKVEIEQGDRFFTRPEGKPVAPVKGADIDVVGQETGKIDIHFNYHANPTEEEKKIMIEAVKYLNQDLNREGFENRKLFTEFFYSRINGYKFVEYFEDEAADFWVRFKKKF